MEKEPKKITKNNSNPLETEVENQDQQTKFISIEQSVSDYQNDLIDEDEYTRRINDYMNRSK